MPTVVVLCGTPPALMVCFPPTGQQNIVLRVKRLVHRSTINVNVVDGGSLTVIAGQNLRSALLKSGERVHKFEGEDCGGNGICTTCAVQVLEGEDALSPPTAAEKQRAKGREGWRLSCQTRAGAEGGDVTLVLQPGRGTVEE